MFTFGVDLKQESKKIFEKKIKYRFPFRSTVIWAEIKLLFITFCPIVNIVCGILFIANYDNCVKVNIKVIESQNNPKEE